MEVKKITIPKNESIDTKDDLTMLNGLYFDKLQKPEVVPYIHKKIAGYKQQDYKKKIYHLQNMLEHIVSSGYKGVKLLEIAKHYGVNDN